MDEILFLNSRNDLTKSRYFPFTNHFRPLNKFLKEARDNNSPVYLFVDTKEEIKWAKSLPVDGMITDHIETVGVAFTD
jgi:hypothetical protein